MSDEVAPSTPQRTPAGSSVPAPSSSSRASASPKRLPKPAALRHYRISINLQSIQGLERAIFASFQFTYPHLGSAGVVRTPPQWFQPSAEGRIEKGSVSYELATSKGRLENILASFPIKIDMLRRTNQENDVVGFAVLDLMTTFRTAAYMYVCPVTAKTFKTLDEYRIHAQIMNDQYNNQEIDSAPARDPEVVHATDFFLGMNDDSAKGEGEKPTVAAAKLRVVTVIEDKGEISREKALRVKPGYKMHGGAVYKKPETESVHIQTTPFKAPAPPTPAPPTPAPQVDESWSRNQLMEHELAQMKLDWELWREKAEKTWRENLLVQEQEIKAKAKQEAQAMLENKMEDLKRSQQEVARMEVRLKAASDAVEKQKLRLQQQEDILEGKVAAKLQELQLLTNRVKVEAKTLVEGERQKNVVAHAQIAQLQDYVQTLERKIRNLEQEYLDLKDSQRKYSETLLREELATVRAHLAEAREGIEREKNATAAAVLEKEHYRAQMHRLAHALKREREKTQAMARQEIEQLRLEFLAREERYQLDGDRDMLNTIKSELAALRIFQGHAQHHQHQHQQHPPVSGAEDKGIDESKRSTPPRLEALRQYPQPPIPPQRSQPSLPTPSSERSHHTVAEEGSSQYSVDTAAPPPPPPSTTSISLLHSERFQRLPEHVRRETEALLLSGLYDENDTLIETIVALHK